MSLTFAEAAKQRAEERFNIEIDGMPILFVRRLMARETRMLRESCLRDGKTPDDIEEPGAVDERANSIALIAAACQNEDGSAAFPGGAEEVEELVDDFLLGKLSMKVAEVLFNAGNSGNA